MKILEFEFNYEFFILKENINSYIPDSKVYLYSNNLISEFVGVTNMGIATVVF